MARILVIGGTRFVGRLTAEALGFRHEVTVLSRNATAVPGTSRVIADRADGLSQLAGSRFDCVLDFIAYDDTGVAEAAALGGHYIAISSTWMTKLSSASPDAPARLPEVTRKYLLGKARLEDAIATLRSAGRSATAVRLPIMLGRDDHTGRLEFYRSRVADGGPILLVNGGTNRAQLLWSGDAVRLLSALVESNASSIAAIWEGLPGGGQPVSDFVADIARSMKRSSSVVAVPFDVLARELPSYLDREPLWREQAQPVTSHNLFERFGIRPTPPATWLVDLPPALAAPADREAELAFAARHASSPN